MAYRKVNKNDLLGGVSSVNVEELLKKNNFTYSLDNMQSMVNGWNGNSLWGMDSYLVLVDGVPRDANNVMPSEIKDITFLKGASAVVLYGSRAAKGHICLLRFTFLIPGEYGALFSVIKSSYSDSKQTSDNA